jgi:hypothetical protein
MVPMPETAVYEDHRAQTGKHDVGTAGEIATVKAKAKP